MSRTKSGGPADVHPPVLLRIEKGEPDLSEVAAVIAVLLPRLTAAAPASLRPARAVARWRRPERTRHFQGPRTWHAGTR